MHPVITLADSQEGLMELLKRLYAAFFPPKLEPAKRNPPRERFLLPNEWTTIRTILAGQPLKVRVYFSLLFLLGCRRDELRTVSWAQIDLNAAIWHKLETKNGKRQVLPLPPEAVALFRELPQVSPYCFTGDASNGATVSNQPWSRSALKYWWRKIRHESACADVQIRDLRRSTASWMTMHGENLKIVQKMLDHTSLSTTQIYARLDIKSLGEALNRHAKRIFGRANSPSKENT
ncbi:MAG: hypothetical protein OJF50_002435 [Nitrospira sp.]|nr:hypothetical protein [Nitrospira sp.]